MSQLEEGNEDESDSMDEDTFEEFQDEEDLAHFPLINDMNSNFSRLNKDIKDTFRLS